MSQQNPLEQVVRDFIQMVQARTSSNDLDHFYHPDAKQIEYPNAIVKQTAIRSLKDLQNASERGKKVLQKEEYEIRNLYTIGETVILEATWIGTLAIPLGNIPVGGQMKAYFAQFFDFKNGRIFRQRNYDCFEPFS